MKIKINISNILFYIAYCTWIVIFIMQQTYYKELIEYDMLMRMARGIAYISLVIKLLYDNVYSIKSIFAVFILLVLNIVLIKTNISFIVDTFLFIYSSRNIKLDNIIKITLYINICLMIFTVLSCFIGVIPDKLWYRSSGAVRHGLGYRYTSFSSNFYFHIALMYIYLKRNRKLRFIEVICILIFNYILYKYTNTKAVFVLTNVMIISFFVFQYKKTNLKNNWINKILFKYCFPICATFSIGFSIKYNGNSFYKILDTLLSNRLKLGHNAYNQYGIKLFGQNIIWSMGDENLEVWQQTYNFIDSAYMQLLINYGIVLLVLICIGYIYVGKYAIKENNKTLCIVLLFLALHSVTDPQLMELRYNPFLLMFSMFFSTKSMKNILYERK